MQWDCRLSTGLPPSSWLCRLWSRKEDLQRAWNWVRRAVWDQVALSHCRQDSLVTVRDKACLRPGHNDQSCRGHQCSETMLTGESQFHINTPLGIEPGSLMTGSKWLTHWTSETVYECSEIAGSPQYDLTGLTLMPLEIFEFWIINSNRSSHRGDPKSYLFYKLAATACKSFFLKYRTPTRKPLATVPFCKKQNCCCYPNANT
jgi:hypothetical protein